MDNSEAITVTINIPQWGAWLALALVALPVLVWLVFRFDEWNNHRAYVAHTRRRLAQEHAAWVRHPVLGKISSPYEKELREFGGEV